MGGGGAGGHLLPVLPGYVFGCPRNRTAWGAGEVSPQRSTQLIRENFLAWEKCISSSCCRKVQIWSSFCNVIGLDFMIPIPLRTKYINERQDI